MYYTNSFLIKLLILNIFRNSINLFLVSTLCKQNNTQNNPQRLLFIS